MYDYAVTASCRSEGVEKASCLIIPKAVVDRGFVMTQTVDPVISVFNSHRPLAGEGLPAKEEYGKKS